jgi:hypothetical protein
MCHAERRDKHTKLSPENLKESYGFGDTDVYGIL